MPVIQAKSDRYSENQETEDFIPEAVSPDAAKSAHEKTYGNPDPA